LIGSESGYSCILDRLGYPCIPKPDNRSSPVLKIEIKLKGMYEIYWVELEHQCTKHLGFLYIDFPLKMIIKILPATSTSYLAGFKLSPVVLLAFVPTTNVKTTDHPALLATC
jgi:hypothetical protein